MVMRHQKSTLSGRKGLSENDFGMNYEWGNLYIDTLSTVAALGLVSV
jgi:hypothetical protein